jgi:hypothetical protein
MKLTKAEQRLCSKEHSYRAERALFGTLTVVSGIMYPFLIWTIARNWWASFPGKQSEFWTILKQLDWQGMAPGALIFLLFFFLAYRAQAKLSLIKHLEFHLKESREREIAANNASEGIRQPADGLPKPSM